MNQISKVVGDKLQIDTAEAGGAVAPTSTAAAMATKTSLFFSCMCSPP